MRIGYSNTNHRKFDAIVCLSAIDWDFLWQRTQEIMSQFAALGYPVLFVENTGVRVPGFKDAPRVWNRLKKIITSPQKQADVQNHINIKVFSPKALPFPYSPLAIKYNLSHLRSVVLRFSRETGIPVNRILLWSYMTTPLAVKLAESLPWAGVVVDLVSDPCKVEGAEAVFASHKKILEMADVVLCASSSVMNTAWHQLGQGWEDKLHLFEDGFSTRLWQLANEVEEEFEFPWEQSGRPIAAYIGGVNNKIWWDAVSAMAAGLPEVNFVFVGPKEYGELPCQGVNKNIHWHPSFAKYSQLGRFLKSCSVGLIPYVPTSYVLEMRPAKINEYLVMGLPIVSSRMPELERFAEGHGEGIIYFADQYIDFAAALNQALEEDSQLLREKRRNIVLERSWESVCSDLALLIHSSLE